MSKSGAELNIQPCKDDATKKKVSWRFQPSFLIVACAGTFVDGRENADCFFLKNFCEYISNCIFFLSLLTGYVFFIHVSNPVNQLIMFTIDLSLTWNRG